MSDKLAEALREAAAAQLAYMDLCGEKGDLERNLRAALAAYDAATGPAVRVDSLAAITLKLAMYREGCELSWTTISTATDFSNGRTFPVKAGQEYWLQYQKGRTQAKELASVILAAITSAFDSLPAAPAREGDAP